MNWLKDLMTRMGITVPEDKQAEFDQAVAEQDKKLKTPPTPPAGVTIDAATQAFIGQSIQQAVSEAVAPLKAENEKLLKILGDERTSRENAAKALKEKQEEENKSRVNALIEGAIKDGRLQKDNTDLNETYRKMAEADYEAAKKVLEAMPKPKGPTDTKRTDSGAQGEEPGSDYKSVMDAARAEFSTN